MGWPSMSLPQALRGPGALAALALALGCSDGYPTDDAPPLEPASMTQAQLLEALNQLADEASPERHGRYGLEPGCRLVLTTRDGAGAPRSVGLDGADIEARFVADDGRYEIQVRPRGDAGAEAVALFETRRWTDSVQATALLSQLARRCGETAAPG